MPNPSIEKIGELLRYANLATAARCDDLAFDITLEICGCYLTVAGYDAKPSHFPDIEEAPGDIFYQKPSQA